MRFVNYCIPILFTICTVSQLFWNRVCSQKSEEHWSQPQTSRPRLAKHLMHMVHLSGNTSALSKTSADWLNYTGFPGDVCIAFFNVLPGNKDAVTPNPLTKEESCRVQM